MEELSTATTSVERFGNDFGAERMWGLKELPLPDAASLFPETVGWTYLALLLVSLVVGYVWRRFRHWQQQAPLREALAQLVEMRSNAHLLSTLPKLLRQAALTLSSRSDIATLDGVAWIEWLNTKAKRPVFQTSDADLFSLLAYSAEPKLDAQDSQRLIAACEQWIEASHV